jgi:MFS family permease
MKKDEPTEIFKRKRKLGFLRFSSKAGFSGLSSQVYILVFLGFLFSLGRNIAFPYLAMFLAGKTQNGGLGFDSYLVGLMLMTGGFASTFALLFTGSLCDRFGRKIMMMSSLIPQILLTIGFAYVHAYLEFLLLFAIYGIVMAFFNPAYSAMIADLVQPEKREQVYGLNYMVGNVGFMAGLPIGGLIASMSGFSVLYFYAAIFVSAAATGLGLLIKESKPLEVAKEKFFSDVTPFFRDRVFILFCFMGTLTIVVYSQLYSMLSVYTEYLGFEPYFFGFLSSIAGAMVVTLQIPIRLGTVRIGPTKAFIIAETLFGAGFICFMFAANFSQFLVAIAILTIGEIIFFPASSAFVANLAPADMRGRYLALMGLFFGIGDSTAELTIFSIYGLLANKSLIWGIWGTLGFAILPGYLMLFKMAKRHRSIPTRP